MKIEQHKKNELTIL